MIFVWIGVAALWAAACGARETRRGEAARRIWENRRRMRAQVQRAAAHMQAEYRGELKQLPGRW